jgi:hypothetical protein
MEREPRLTLYKHIGHMQDLWYLIHMYGDDYKAWSGKTKA